MITSFAEILAEAASEPMRTLAVAAAGQKEVLLSAQAARQQGIAEPLLVGD